MEQRFENFHLKMASGCWEWQAFCTPQGYGKFKALGEQLAHRVSFALHIGPVPKLSCICHKCDNPSCVNPEHLFLGDFDINNKDRAAKGRTVIHNSLKTHCKRGHEFNVENTYIRKSGRRLCKVCQHLKYKGVL